MINIPRVITLNKQKLDKIEYDLRKALNESSENALNRLDLMYAITHIQYALFILRDIEKHIDNINKGGV